MRSMFLQHSPNLNCKIKEQVRYINQMVVDWATPKILSEIDSERLNEISKRSYELVDGKGTIRMAEQIINLEKIQ